MGQLSILSKCNEPSALYASSLSAACVFWGLLGRLD